MNSIFLQNLQNKKLFGRLETIVKAGDFGPSAIAELKKICSKLWDGKNLLFSSTQMMRNIMDDLIDYSQIKSGFFRKKLDTFDLKETIEEVMNIQRK